MQQIVSPYGAMMRPALPLINPASTGEDWARAARFAQAMFHPSFSHQPQADWETDEEGTPNEAEAETATTQTASTANTTDGKTGDEGGVNTPPLSACENELRAEQQREYDALIAKFKADAAQMVQNHLPLSRMRYDPRIPAQVAANTFNAIAAEHGTSNADLEQRHALMMQVKAELARAEMRAHCPHHARTHAASLADLGGFFPTLPNHIGHARATGHALCAA